MRQVDLWGSQSWLPPAFSRRLLGSETLAGTNKPPKKRPQGKIACPTKLLGFLDFGPAGALRGGDTGSPLGTHAMFLLSGAGFRPALRFWRCGRGLPQHGAQFRHLCFNLLEMLLVTYQRRFQGGFVKTNGHIPLIISCTDRH